jgi:hydrogenase expression/formation protein HypE
MTIDDLMQRGPGSSPCEGEEEGEGARTDSGPLTPGGLAFSCPVPPGGPDHILMAHGGGGRMTWQLLEHILLPAFRNPALEARHDGAVVPVSGGRLAITTDSHVVSPLFFPGGDIGTLAVNGTVNDLAMCGARPRYLSVGLILEEGLPIDTLRRVVASMARAAREASVQLVTGDTKVVDRGKGDGVFINTTGIGVIDHDLSIGPAAVRPGDAVILSGDLGRHGIAIMAGREGITLETTLESDCAPLHAPVQALIDAGIEVHCLRDLTRGGLATALLEIAGAGRCHVHLEEARIPVPEEVAGACEILGLDPLYVANEGRFVCFVPEADAGRAVEVLRAHPVSAGAVRIGEVRGGDRLETVRGGDRLEAERGGDRLDAARGGDRLETVRGGDRLEAERGGDRLEAARGGDRLEAARGGGRPEAARGGDWLETVRGRRGGLVTLRSRIGTSRILDLLSGEQLPRIC